MATEVYHRDLGNGTAQSFLDDGSTVIWDITTGQQVAATPADPTLARAMRYGSMSDVQAAVDQSIAIAEALDNSVIGQREREQRQAGIDRYDAETTENTRRYDQDYGLRSDQQRFSQGYQDRSLAQTAAYQNRSLDLQEKEADRRFGLDQQRFGLEQQRFGLDQSRFGADLLQQDIQYRNQPSSWLKLADWEYGLGQSGSAPYALQAVAAGKLATPGFVARSGVPGTASMADVAQGLNTGQYGAANAGTSAGTGSAAPTTNVNANTTDPRVAAVNAILKASGAPSDHPGLSTQDAATLDLISKMYAAGSHKYANTFGSLPKDTQSIFYGGVQGIGGSPTAWDEGIQASKWRQGSLQAA